MSTVSVGPNDLVIAVEDANGKETVIIIRSSRGGDHIAQILALRRQLGLPEVRDVTEPVITEPARAGHYITTRDGQKWIWDDPKT